MLPGLKSGSSMFFLKKKIKKGLYWSIEKKTIWDANFTALIRRLEAPVLNSHRQFVRQFHFIFWGISKISPSL